MSSVSLDDQIAATLEPEELAAIRGDEPTAAEQEALKSIAAGAPKDQEVDEDEGSTLDADGKPVQVAAAPAPAPAAAAPAPADEPVAVVQEVAAAPAAPQPGPAFVAPLPADFDAQVAALKSATDELGAKFKAGEIDVDTYRSESDKLAERRDGLNSIRIEHSIAQKMEQQTQERQLRTEVERTFRLGKAEGIDYQNDEAKRSDLDGFVKALASNPANDDKSLPWFFDEAHKRVKTLYGIAAAPAAAATPAAPSAKPSAAQVKADALAARKPPIDAAPKGLAQVPGGDGPGDVAGEFADVDNLEGDELEIAIGRMTPERRERYMRGL